MRSKKIKPQKPFRLELRITEKQKIHILEMSDALNISESDFIRMLIDKSIANLVNERI